MRPWLRWLLFLSVLSSVAAIWWPDTVTHAIARVDVAVIQREPESFANLNSTSVVIPTTTQLPSTLPAMILDKADFDPFVGQQPQPSTTPPKPAPAPVVVAPPPPAPTAPALPYRYLGQMVDPSGKRYVYLGKADKEMPVAVGTQLDEGYVVEAIAADGVHVHYPPLDTRAVISIPADNGTALP
jgi:hypothetical protein